MKKVVLLGDSIRQIGYGAKVAQMLKDEFTVWQPEENCRFSYHTLRMLFDKKEEIEGADIIHWNNGLWDICDIFGDGPFTPIDDYVNVMVRIAKILKTKAKAVIFATITPCPPENVYNKNEVIIKYNEALVPKLKEIGVIINDLFTPINSDIRKYIDQNDMIHLSEEGIELAADKVAALIRETAKSI